MTDETNGNKRQERQERDVNTVTEYDRKRGGLEGVAIFSRPATIQSVQFLTGKAETFVVETARHEEDRPSVKGIRRMGDTIFIQCMDDRGVTRLALPPKVARIIAAQSKALTSRLRSRHSKAVAQARKDRGELPGFMKNKRS